MSTVTAKQSTNDQRIRGPKLSVLISRNNGVPFEEGLVKANAENRVIASNKRLSNALVGSEEWRTIKEVFACWTGTMTAYAKPGEKLGKAVEYVDPETKYRWVFPVPEAHQDKKDAILVAEHPDYSLEIDGKTRIVRAAQVDLIERFPAENDWYFGDSKHDIPSGDSVEASDDARYLYRMDTLVGPVARGCDDGDDGYGGGDRRGVDLGDGPSGGLGVAVEAPERGAPQKLQVSQALETSGILVKGITLDEFRALVGDANTDLQDTLQMIRPEKLAAMQRLLQALDIKE